MSAPVLVLRRTSVGHQPDATAVAVQAGRIAAVGDGLTAERDPETLGRVRLGAAVADSEARLTDGEPVFGPAGVATWDPGGVQHD